MTFLLGLVTLLAPTIIPVGFPLRHVEPPVQSVSSTSYCQSGVMADGQQTFVGAVAGNMWPLGTHLFILSGSHKGEIVQVLDRIGWGSQLDLFTWSCKQAWQYGRQQILVEAI